MIGRAAGGLIRVVVFLIFELVLTMLAYTLLNLRAPDTFGYLVRQAAWVLELFTKQLVYWLPGSANAAYATLLGELGPKAILLLLIGLVVAALLRWITETLLGFGRTQ